MHILHYTFVKEKNLCKKSEHLFYVSRIHLSNNYMTDTQKKWTNQHLLKVERKIVIKNNKMIVCLSKDWHTSLIHDGEKTFETKINVASIPYIIKQRNDYVPSVRLISASSKQRAAGDRTSANKIVSFAHTTLLYSAVWCVHHSGVRRLFVQVVLL